MKRLDECLQLNKLHQMRRQYYFCTDSFLQAHQFCVFSPLIYETNSNPELINREACKVTQQNDSIYKQCRANKQLNENAFFVGEC